ncbi:MAG TPA: glycosyltransferase family 4 protein [Acetobacteraceae bacterium]|nr:glycosyltransferase family 4 protein [Acetobacteraceae bacterium]
MPADAAVRARQATVAQRDGAGPVVLYVSSVAELKGGAETVLLEMLRNPGVRPALAAPGPGTLEEFARRRGIPVHRLELGAVGSIRRPVRPGDLGRAGRDALRLASQIAAIAQATDAALVHANGLKVHVTGCLARLLHGTPTIVHMHDVPYSRAERLIWSALSRAARHTIAASDICFPTGTRRVSVVMQGVDSPPAPVPRTLGARPVLGFVGRFHPFKGVHLLLDWFESVTAEFQDLTLLLRGRADAEGARYWSDLQPRAQRLVAAGRCRIEGWRPAAEDPLADIDVLIAPSATPEVGPRIIMEAMLRGIPAIGYPTGGALRMIPRPEVGALAANADQLRTALRRLLDPACYAQVSAAALAHAAAEFGIGRFWQSLSDVYQSVLDK